MAGRTWPHVLFSQRDHKNEDGENQSIFFVFVLKIKIFIIKDTQRTTAAMELEMEEAQRQMSERKAQSERAQRAGTERIAEPGKSIRSFKRSFGF